MKDKCSEELRESIAKCIEGMRKDIDEIKSELSDFKRKQGGLCKCERSCYVDAD